MKRKISNFLILSLVAGMLAAAFYQEDLAGQLSYVAGQLVAEQEEFVVVIDTDTKDAGYEAAETNH